MKKMISLIVAVVFITISCTNESKNVAEIPTDFSTEFMYGNAAKLEQLLNPNDVSNIINIPANEISAYQENFDDNTTTQFLLFSWLNGETIQAGDQKIAARSSIGFGRIQKISPTDFSQKYQQKTASSVKAEIQKITTDEKIDADEAIWEAKEIAKEAKSQSFEKLENVGSAAFWETPKNVLHVLVNDLSFTISANFGNDEVKNKEKSIALAQLLFKKSKSNPNLK